MSSLTVVKEQLGIFDIQIRVEGSDADGKEAVLSSSHTRGVYRTIVGFPSSCCLETVGRLQTPFEDHRTDETPVTFAPSSSLKKCTNL